MLKPVNAAEYKKAIALGKELVKKPDMNKAKIARQMYPLVEQEDKKVIARAFVDGGAFQASCRLKLKIMLPYLRSSLSFAFPG